MELLLLPLYKLKVEIHDNSILKMLNSLIINKNFIKIFKIYKYYNTHILILKSSDAENKKYYSLTKLVIESVWP